MLKSGKSEIIAYVSFCPSTSLMEQKLSRFRLPCVRVWLSGFKAFFVSFVTFLHSKRTHCEKTIENLTQTDCRLLKMLQLRRPRLIFGLTLITEPIFVTQLTMVGGYPPSDFQNEPPYDAYFGING